MDRAALVGEVKGVGDLGQQAERLVRLQRPATRLTFEQLRQADAVDQLGDEVHRTLELAPLVDGDDVGVTVEGGGDLSLVDEPLADHVIGGVAVGKHLERHLATESEVRRRVHDGGAATMDGLIESVLVDDLTGLKRHERSPGELDCDAAGKYGSRIRSSNHHGDLTSAILPGHLRLLRCERWTSVGDDSWPSVVLPVQSASAPHSDDWPLPTWRAVSRDLRRRRGRIRSRSEWHRVIRGRTVSCCGRGSSPTWSTLTTPESTHNRWKSIGRSPPTRTCATSNDTGRRGRYRSMLIRST